MISALGKYGLLEAAGQGEARISDIAMQILFPHDEGERNAALREAALRPVLFSEIREKWPDRPPSDESLRSYLVRKGFSQGALDQVIQIYRDTIEVAGLVQADEDGALELQHREVQSMNPQASPTLEPQQMAVPAAHQPPPTGGKPFTVAFDGSVLTGTIAIRSVRDIDRLMRVLSAQKAAFEAMEDDENLSGGGVDTGPFEAS